MESNFEIDQNGDVCWYDKDDNIHRSDGPAIERTNGFKAWFIHGKCHREDGPAMILYSSKFSNRPMREHWFLNDREYFLETMPIKLFMIYCNWEYKKKNGI